MCIGKLNSTQYCPYFWLLNKKKNQKSKKDKSKRFTGILEKNIRKEINQADKKNKD